MSIFNNIWVKRLPLYATCFAFVGMGIYMLLSTKEAPIIFKIICVPCCLIGGCAGLLMIVNDIRMAINHNQPAGCDNKGVWYMRMFVPWERIQEFKIARGDDNLKEIRIIVKDQMEEIQAMKNPFSRMCYKIMVKQKGTIHVIPPEFFNGSAESFVAYLEGEKKRYGKE